jgi:pilus assembly protein CpaC
MLSGSVANAAESQQAYDVASRLVGSADKVVNNLTIRGRDQVMLKVTVAEVQRDIIKQLGIDLNGSLTYGSAVLNFNNSNPFTALGQPLVDGNAITGQFKTVSATLRAMERAGVIRTLAEPNLTAISGETATFVAGGEFPIPNGLSCDTTKSPPVCQAQIDFKKFGVSLVFTPIVIAEGRISLKVMTEVSDLSSDNAITLQVPGSESLTVPSITTRRADTTVELPSGGSLALAGMIQQKTKQQINGVPGLMQVPILGSLFRSRDFINNQTELVVMVTPYIVHPVAQAKLSRPDDGYGDPTDPETVFLGRLNRVYGANGAPTVAAKRTYQGNYGFILD